MHNGGVSPYTFDINLEVAYHMPNTKVWEKSPDCALLRNTRRKRKDKRDSCSSREISGQSKVYVQEMLKNEPLLP